MTLLINCLGRHDLTETTRAMVKRGSDDLKKLASLQVTLVRATFVESQIQ